MMNSYHFKGLGNSVLFAAERLRLGADYVSIQTIRTIPSGVFYVVNVIASLDGISPPSGSEPPLDTSTTHPYEAGKDKETCGFGSHVWHDSDVCDCGEQREVGGRGWPAHPSGCCCAHCLPRLPFEKPDHLKDTP